MLKYIVAAALVFSSVAAKSPCSPKDVSIVQDNAYNDMSSSWIQTSSGIAEDKMAVFSAEFRLFCKSEQMKDVPVHASISFRSGSGAFSVVPGLSDIGVLRNEGGSYQFSFALPHKDTPSGEYKADIFISGQNSKAASVSIMHSVPLVSGRHMEMLALVILGALSWNAQSNFAASQ